MLRETGGDGIDGFGRRPAEPRAHATHQGRLRSHRQARAGPDAVVSPPNVSHTPLGLDEDDARHLRRVRIVPAALPDLPGDRTGDRLAAGAHRGDARSRATQRADRRCLPPRDGRMRAVSRLRSRVPVRCAVRTPHGGHARRRAPATPPAAAAPPGRMGRIPRRAARITPCSSCSRGACSSGSGCISCRSGSGSRASHAEASDPLDVPIGGDPDAWLFTGCVMDAWMRDTHRTTARVMRAAGARIARPAAGGTCCGALHVHAGRDAEARALARRVIASMPGSAPVVVNSAGCGASMKEYGHLLGTPEAGAFAARVEDFSEWLGAHRCARDPPAGRAGRRPGSVPPAPCPEGAHGRPGRARWCVRPVRHRR